MKITTLLFLLVFPSLSFADGAFDLTLTGGNFDVQAITEMPGYAGHRVDPEGDTHLWLIVNGVSQAALDTLMASFNEHDELVKEAAQALKQEGRIRFKQTFSSEGSAPEELEGQQLYEIMKAIMILRKVVSGGTPTQGEVEFMAGLNSRFNTSVEGVKNKIKDHIQGSNGETALSALTDVQLEAIISNPSAPTLWD